MSRKPLSATAETRRKPAQRGRRALTIAARHTTPQSLRDLAYESIKHRIITCAFKPGEYINEAQVSAVLGLGRTPVHQAIDRLMLDGMVEVIPRKGVIVKPVSLDEVLQIIEARLIVEPQAIRLATERAEETEIAALGEILGRAQQWTAVRNVEQMMLLDREFHLVLARATRNDIFADILCRLHERSLRFWFISLTDVSHHGEVQDEHRAIMQAVQGRDADAAEAAMRRHIESFRANVARFI
jgi:DNA-binding GntR family transcriptional regulator